MVLYDRLYYVVNDAVMNSNVGSFTIQVWANQPLLLSVFSDRVVYCPSDSTGIAAFGAGGNADWTNVMGDGAWPASGQPQLGSDASGGWDGSFAPRGQPRQHVPRPQRRRLGEQLAQVAE